MVEVFACAARCGIWSPAHSRRVACVAHVKGAPGLTSRYVRGSGKVPDPREYKTPGDQIADMV
ncbi:MAG TPA: hypothetical protein VMK12_25065 [Anaeromyxobacteraceae bacterium]|nr:hypothetical protein [Anaeromyxobacteraceae bacterium]